MWQGSEYQQIYVDVLSPNSGILPGNIPVCLPYTTSTVVRSELLKSVVVGSQYIGPRTWADASARVLGQHPLVVTRYQNSMGKLTYSKANRLQSNGIYCGDTIVQQYYNESTSVAFKYAKSVVGSDIASSSMTNACQIRCINKAGEAVANLSITAGEMPKTLKMVSDFTKRLYKGYKLAKRGDVYDALRSIYQPTYITADPKIGLKRFQYARRELALRRNRRKPTNHERLTDKWMAFQYGIMPAINDVGNLLDHVYRNRKQKDQVLRFSSSVTSNGNGGFGYNTLSPQFHTISTQDKGVYSSVLANHVHLYTETIMTVKTVKAVLWVKVVRPDLVSNNQTFGNLGSLLYELTPLSFVVDHFYKVGDWIAATTALSGLEVVSGMTSESLQTKRTLSAKPNADFYAATGMQERTVSTYSRDAWVGGLPSMPALGSQLNGNSRWQNLVTYTSLLDQLLIRRR